MSDEDIITYWEGMEYTCALKVAEVGPHALQFIGDIYGLTRERIRQLIYWKGKWIKLTDGTTKYDKKQGVIFKLLKLKEFRTLLMEYYGCRIKKTS